MNSRIFRLAFVLNCCLFFIQNSVSGQDATTYNTVIRNIQQALTLDITNTAQEEQSVSDMLRTLLPAGNWPDIEYQNHAQTFWNPRIHLARLKKMAAVYAFPASKFYHDEKIAEAVNHGLQYWLTAHPKSTNWWYQQIFSSKALGEILVLMRTKTNSINKDVEKNILLLMKYIGGNPNNQYCVNSSSNKINIAFHWIYRGCLTENDSVFNVGVQNATAPIRFQKPGIGFQYDYSYHDHGAQLYIGNYGMAVLDNISYVAMYLKGTAYALTPEQLDLMSDFARNTYFNSIRGQYYSFAIPGRQIAIHDSLLKSDKALLARRLCAVDTVYRKEYMAIENRLSAEKPAYFEVKPQEQHFWISDFSRMIRPGFYFDVRMTSKRTLRTENVNHENKKGYFLADGATDITIDGDEYYNIFPVWNWSRVPGTTAPQLDSLPEMPMSVGGLRGELSFTGGVSDSLNGASVYMMDYKKFRTAAQKSWFFFDNAVVCLGSGIISDANLPINTTVNQTLLKTEVKYNDGQWKTLPFGTEIGKSKGLNSVLHNKILYYLPIRNHWTVAAKKQTGTWNSIAMNQSDTAVSENVFSLWCDHGIRPQNASYAYYVIPNINSTEAADSAVKNNTIRIIENNKNIQAVIEEDGANWLLQSVFYSKKQILKYKKIEIKISEPCLLMLRKSSSSQYHLHIADPTHELHSITIDIIIDGKSRSRDINLPSGVYAGKSTCAEINF